MRYPEFLPKNGTIGFVAPSFGCAIEPYYTGFAYARDKWQSMGYKMDLGPNCLLGEGIGISNTPQKCGKELTDYYCKKDNHVLISCGGGELMCETLDYVDFEAVKQANPKWYMGYSDNTNFTFLLTTLCDTAAIYGPGATAFHMDPWHPALADSFGILSGGIAKEVTDVSEKKCWSIVVSNYDGWEKESLKDEEHPIVPYNITESFQMRAYRGKTRLDVSEEVSMEGRLLGGCMDCLVNLLGTNFDHVTEFLEKYKEEGFVWFIESCDLNVMSIRRAMWQMEHAGWFKYVKGFLIGRPRCGSDQEMMGLDTYRAVTEVVSKYDVPILMDLDIGHTAPMMPLISGSYAKVKAKDNAVEIEMLLK